MTINKPPIKTNVSCTNPECSNLITIPIEQKRELFTENYLKYGKIPLLYCCKACQDAHYLELSESKFFEKGHLKNHESALVRKGYSVEKRWRRAEPATKLKQETLPAFD
jgi:hypothetical protein